MPSVHVISDLTIHCHLHLQKEGEAGSLNLSTPFIELHKYTLHLGYVLY
jgi:hypothetical protein